jgi:hypothetical protein
MKPLSTSEESSRTIEDAGKMKRRASLKEFVVMAGIALSGGIVFLHFSLNTKISELAGDMTPASSAFDLSTAQPAEDLVEDMLYPVDRAVMVDAAASDRHVICAIKKNGSLEVFIAKQADGDTSLRKSGMNNDLRAAAPAFCEAAFARIDT